jgi:alpha-tubulin suppressor-like RCC1 family protein
MGRKDEGQLGNGYLYTHKTPTLIRKEGVIRAEGGTGHSVFLTADGAVWTMGHNGYGQLGTGDTADVMVPFQARAGGVTDISADGNHTLFTTDDTAMWGMGDNSYGQLGLGDSIDSQLAPTTLVASGVAHMASGAQHSLYAAESGDAYSSGRGVYGNLGHGDQSDLSSFTQISTLSDVSRVHASGYTSFFRTGTLTYTDTGVAGYSWYGAGDNSHGQFGDGTWTAPNTTPVLLPFDRVHHMACGYAHVLLARGLPGDIDGDVLWTLRDVVLAQQIMAGNYNGSYPFYLTYTNSSEDTATVYYINYADIDGDGRIGLPEAQHALRRVGGF